ncbi:hypothetical protein EPO33_00735 [Patescibacteria group bacterium]|nr:MAG: hypothetical protein EPO33_00735 [Patescibacteria group bacterium]
MAHTTASQHAFATVLYDTLFGLVLFFSLDSFLTISEPAHFLFFLFATAVLVHWWLMFKAAEDEFGNEFRTAAVHLVLNLAVILLLEFFILNARTFHYLAAALFMLAVFCVDLAWAGLALRAHRFKAKGRRLAAMRTELRSIIATDALVVALLGALTAAAFLFPLPPLVFVLGFVAIYLFYIQLSFKFQIIDLKAF